MIHTSPSRRRLLATGGVALGVAIAGCSDANSQGDGTDDSATALDEPLAVSSATHYQGPACACCDEYVPYLEGNLEGDLDVEVTDELGAVKAGFGVPQTLQSCHTVELEGYVFEGHLPVEPIADYLEAEPDSLGIALPGMPAGSPGMGGEKSEPWTVYELFEDGEYEPFDEI